MPTSVEARLDMLTVFNDCPKDKDNRRAQYTDSIKIMGNSDISRAGIAKNSIGTPALAFAAKGNKRKHTGNTNIDDFNLCCLFACPGKESELR